MRIQQTDQILKASRAARHRKNSNSRKGNGLLRRAWRLLTRILKRG